MSEFKNFFETIPRHLKGPRPNHIGNSLITPGIEFCNIYRRNTGWFRQSSISIYVPAIEKFLENKNSKIRMLASLTGKVNQDVFKALEKTKDEKNKKNILLKYADRTLREQTFLIADPDNWTYQNHLLLYLLAKNKLEIRFAISRPFGTETPQLFHEKAGYFKFQNNEELAFLGNFNESKGSIVNHGERVQVFTSLIKERPNDDDSNLACYFDDSRDIKYYIEELDLQWKGFDEGTEVHKVNEDTLQEIKKYSLSSSELKNLRNKENNPKKNKNIKLSSLKRNVPVIPSKYKGSEFDLRKHQKEALKNWEQNNYKGILEHATGSGKTISAICGICSIAKKSKKIALISVPFQSLADQWMDELEMFNIYAIKCYESSRNWINKAPQEISKWNNKQDDDSYISVFVTVNKTLSDPRFQKIISEFDLENTIAIGDECHRYAKYNGTKYLPDAFYRLGLSATPFNEGDDIGNNELKDFFGNQIEPRYTLSDALNAIPQVLTNYMYFPISCYLNEEEFEKFREQSAIAAAYYNKDDYGQIPSAASSAIAKMNRIKGSCADKFIKLRNLLPKLNKNDQAIFFCGDGSTEEDEKDALTNDSKDIEKVSSLLFEKGWISSQFTYREKTLERKRILENFSEGSINALVFMKVLDEGIDVPGVGIAVLLASSRNRRQFVQRRGRVLRKSPNKDLAYIYDFICLPPDLNSSDNLVNAEIERIKEMMADSSNKEMSEKYLKEIMIKYNLK